MKLLQNTLLFALLACLPSGNASARDAPAKRVPAPETVSPEMRELIDSPFSPLWKQRPRNVREWKSFADDMERASLPIVQALRDKLDVTVTPGSMAGVPVFTLTPKNLSDAGKGRVLLHFHGGGYVLGPGESGLTEALLMAGLGGFTVVAVDYRMAPDFPYPAAMDDSTAVYRALLQTVPAEKIGVFGSSTGGGMTLSLVLRAKAEGLPLPAAVAPGTPWTDLTKTGDSYYTNEHVDNVLVSYDGWVKAAAELYAGEHDLKDPMLSPVYGDVSGFPPTLLTSGTRDLFLSNTVRMHLKLREAGVDADLIVFEGQSHAQFLMLPDAPETKFHFTELTRFFDRHLK